jgi:hypothetical protein
MKSVLILERAKESVWSLYWHSAVQAIKSKPLCGTHPSRRSWFRPGTK